MRRTRIESFKTWRGGFTYLIIRKGLYIFTFSILHMTILIVSVFKNLMESFTIQYHRKLKYLIYAHILFLQSAIIFYKIVTVLLLSIAALLVHRVCFIAPTVLTMVLFYHYKSHIE